MAVHVADAGSGYGAVGASNGASNHWIDYPTYPPNSRRVQRADLRGGVRVRTASCWAGHQLPGGTNCRPTARGIPRPPGQKLSVWTNSERRPTGNGWRSLGFRAGFSENPSRVKPKSKAKVIQKAGEQIFHLRFRLT